MLNKLTDRSRKILKIAEQEARRLNSEFIGTEHLLLGVLGEGGGSAFKVLVRMGVVPEDMKAEIEKVAADGVANEPSAIRATIPFSPRAKRVLELSEEVAAREGMDVIATEHILVGLFREEEGIAFNILKNAGVTRSGLEAKLDEVLGKSAEDEARQRLAAIQARIMSPPPGPRTVRVWIFKDQLMADQRSQSFLMFQNVKVFASEIIEMQGVPADKREAIAASIAKECGAIAYLVEVR